VSLLVVRQGEDKGEREDLKREMLFKPSAKGENLEGPKGPREHAILSRTNPPGSSKGYGFFGGMKTLKHRRMADEVMCESARAERNMGNPVSTTKKEDKALKGETHERWALKKVPKDGETETIKRVAKP
jgi:hypothetical protein